jgi:phosphohistidine phosphatase
MRLLVLRHAKSSWADSSLDDWERPLNDRGERDAPRVGALLRRLSLVPDLIVSSDAVRAHSPARAAADAAGYAGRIVLSPALYGAGPQAIIDVLRNSPDPAARSVMIVGHNPGLEDFVSQLSGESIELATATLVHLDVPINQWSDIDLSQGAALIDVWHPRDM